MLAVTSRTRQPWMRNAVFRHNRQVPATIFNDLKLSRWLKIKPSMSVSESIASRASAAALAAPRRRVSIQCRIAPTFAALCVQERQLRGASVVLVQSVLGNFTGEFDFRLTARTRSNVKKSYVVLLRFVLTHRVHVTDLIYM